MGEIESRKEFVTRMYLLLYEIPEEKRDLSTMLSFFSIQLRQREMSFAKYAVDKVVREMSSRTSLTLRHRNTIVDIFSNAFSEREYTFEPTPTQELEEFLLDKSKFPTDGKKNTTGFIEGLRNTDPNKTRADKKCLEEVEESNE